MGDDRANYVYADGNTPKYYSDSVVAFLSLFADVQRMGDRYTVPGGWPRLLQIAAHFGQPGK